MESLTDFYNKFYGGKDHPFGVQASEITIELLKFLPPKSTVVDVGSGDGRNTALLLKHGCSVFAIEPSNIAQDILKPLKEKFLGQLTQITDYAENVATPAAEAALFSFVLHHLKKDEAITLLKKYQTSIPLHAISTFTPKSVFAKQSPQNFFPDEDELKELYKNWDILFLKIKDETAAQQKGGNPIINQTIHFIARKRVAQNL